MEDNYELVMEIFEVDSIDGTEPFPKETETVAIRYEHGAPSSVLLTATASLKDLFERGAPTETIRDPERVRAIARYFHSRH
jgi:hypothetical protein